MYSFGFSAMQCTPTESSFFYANPGYQVVDIVIEKGVRNHQNGHEEEIITSFKPLQSGMKLSEHIIQVEKSELEHKEFDVETVLQKQDTHDLFCPNCNSRITRSVILRKRKRYIEDIHQGTKGDTFETTTTNNINSILVENNDTIGNENDREPEVFRCLSCFSFFIPSGKNFKLFRFFGDKNDEEEMPTPQQSATKSNWFRSFFTSDKGDNLKKEVKTIEQLKYPLLSNDIESQTENEHIVSPVATTKHVNGVKPGQHEVTFNSSTCEIQVAPDASTKHVSGIKPEPHEVTINSSTCDFQVTSSGTTIQLSNGETVTGVTSTEASISVTTTGTYSEERTDDIVEANKTDEAQRLQHGTLTPSRALADGYDIESSISCGTWILPSAHIGEYVSNDIAQMGNEKKMVSVASTQVPTFLKTTYPYNAVEVKETGGDDFITFANGEADKTTNFQVAQNLIGSNNTEVLPDSGIQVYVSEPGVEEGEVRGWDILKSIVYGGLTESITSLGVVTSAVGAGASTLNVVALGLANLIGGLFVIGHNLRELKNDHSERTSSQIDEQATDRYYELLGRREKYILHMVVVILSYIIFGLVPPIVYGFSFRKSGDSDYKLATVSVISIICVILLALGKGHVKTPKSYIKTLLHYVTMAIMASGISYLAGILIEQLLDKLGWIDSSSFAIQDLKREWSSY